jgi:hypothetical protein
LLDEGRTHVAGTDDCDLHERLLDESSWIAAMSATLGVPYNWINRSSMHILG